MAKTIKEMADEAYKPIIGQLVVCNECYQEGANAALNEIKVMLEQHYTTFNATASDVLNKIKELKGK